MFLLYFGADKTQMMCKRNHGLAQGCDSPPDQHQGSLKIFHHVSPKFFFSCYCPGAEDMGWELGFSPPGVSPRFRGSVLWQGQR